MKYLPFIAPWFFVLMLTALLVNYNILLNNSWDREKEWKATAAKWEEVAKTWEEISNKNVASFKSMQGSFYDCMKLVKS